MRFRAGAALVFLLAATPAFAVKEWYDYYLEASDGHMRSGRYVEAIQALQQAIRLKPESAVNERTYGMNFVDYLPYYHLGVCYLKTGDFNSAQRMFNIEEDKGAVKRTSKYRDLLKQRTEAENAERQRVAKLARDEVERLLKEAAELGRTKRYDEALARIAQAQAAAVALDPATQARILEAKEKLRADQQAQTESAARAQRIDQALSEARRLLDEGRATEAIVRFDEVLGLDAKNQKAADGKREAQEHILASQTRQKLLERFAEGKKLFEAGQYEEALAPLTDAAVDPENAAARDLLAQARRLVEGMQKQRDIASKIEALMSEGERLLEARKHAEASVKFEAVLQLDPENPKARERLAFAQRMTGEDIFSKIFPNQPPVLFFYEPRTNEVEGPSVGIVGVATDDRGVVKVEFKVGGRVVAQQVPPPRMNSNENLGSVSIQREFPLNPGLNEISVTATDTAGATRSQTFQIVRLLRFYETKTFLPSAFGAAIALLGAGFAAQRARKRRAVRNRFNPYIAGAPVLDDDMFFGREKLMTRIMNVLHHNSLMITGERRIGKTTFMYHLKKTLETDEGTDYKFFPVFTDLQGVPEDGFFHAVMSDVVECLALAPDTLGSMRYREDGPYDGRDFSHDIQRVIEELKTRTPRRVKLAFLIDEVDVLNEYSERINQRLRSIFMKTFSEHLVAIMSGVGIKRAWKSEGSPWYNFFDEIELTGFSREDAESLIRTPVDGIFRFEPEAVEMILGASDLKPYVIQKYCIHALNHMLEEGREVVRTDDIVAVRDAVKFEGRDDAVAGALDRPASA